MKHLPPRDVSQYVQFCLGFWRARKTYSGSYGSSISVLLFGFLLSTLASANPIPLSNIDMVATGDGHACSLSIDGASVSTVNCWGNNGSGQLGNGTTIGHIQPRPVQGLPTNISAITAGNNHSCALTINGNAWCWGLNNNGQLGINSTNVQYLPVQVNGLSGVTKLDAGGFHTCAITANFDTFCWGRNFYGELGDGTNTNRLVPTAVVSMPAFANNISAGVASTCATTSTGILVCWGFNNSGQLGDGTIGNRNVPTNVSGVLNGNATTVSIHEDHACAVRTLGGVWCWGDNFYGQLGDNTAISSLVPVEVVGISSAKKVSVGLDHSCATTQSDAPFCWGQNTYGELGNTTFRARPFATAVEGLSDVVQIGAGGRYSCGVLGTGGLQCWGQNTNGQLGDGSTANYFSPQTVLNAPSNGTGLALGDQHSCMLSSNGSLRCWGSSIDGQIGDDSYSQRLVPRLVIPANVGASSVSTGDDHSCALAPQGGLSKAFCWGKNFSGQLGDGSNVLRLSPTPVSSSASSIASIGAGSEHTCLADAAGNVECSGRNSYGQTCRDVSSDSNQFQQCNIALPNALIVRSGRLHSCALTSLNQVWCWGYNGNGELGIGNNANSSNPVRVSALDGNVITDIAVGDEHSCALTSVGIALCWGGNREGQLGNGTTSSSNTPVTVTGVAAPIAQLALGGEFSCARLTNAAMQCWGDNGKGQMGSGFHESSSQPIHVDGMSFGVAAIAAGEDHACAIRSNGSVQCWGQNINGQLGNGFALNRAWPASVTFASPFVFENGFEQ